MPHDPRWHDSTERRKLQNRLRAEARPCWICRAMGRTGTIDYSLRFPHPYSFEMDELIPVSKYQLGGYPSAKACALDYKNLAATHRCCNQWRSNRTVDEVMRIAMSRAGGTKPPTRRVTSRDWGNPCKEVDDA